MRKKICPAVSITPLICGARWPNPATTMPLRIEISSVCSRSPPARASKKLLGMIPRMWFTALSLAAARA